MKKYDVSGFIGSWPFRKIFKGTLADLKALHAANGISGGLVGSITGVFHNDPYENDIDAAEIIKGSGYGFVMTANPMLPGSPDDLEKGKKELGAVAVRLCPSYHKYALTDPTVVEYCRKAGELGLRVIVTERMEDYRLDYLINQSFPPAGDTAALAKACPETKFLLSSAAVDELGSIAGDINSLPNLWADISNLNHYLFSLDVVLDGRGISADKLIYGSMSPLYCMRSTLLNVENSAASNEIKNKIMSNNFEDFMA